MTAPHALIAGRYRLVHRVGSGGMGVVWEAWDERLQRAVALKLLHPQPGLSEAEAELANDRAMREARITARLHHRYAVSVFDVAEHDGQPCLIMQFVPSRPLSAVLRERGVLSIDETAVLGAQVASALAAAHQVGVVHRDVKPGNILITGDGTALISDFGISHALGDVTLTATGLVHGTPAFLAPEIARGGESDFASDVFSLGGTLYAALEGAPPFGKDQNSMALLHKVASGQFNPPRRSGPLTPILLRMLSPNPEDRPPMSEVAQVLAGLVAQSEAAFEADRPTVTAKTITTTSTASPTSTAGTASPPAVAPAPMTAPPEAPSTDAPIPAPALAAPAATHSEPAAATPGRSTPQEPISQPMETGTMPAEPPPTQGPPPRRGRILARASLGVAALVGVAILVFALPPVLNRDGATTTNVPADTSQSPIVPPSTAPTPSPTVATSASAAETPAFPPPSASSASSSASPSSSTTSSQPTTSKPTTTKPTTTKPTTTKPTTTESPPVTGSATSRQLARAISSYYALMPGNTDRAWSRMTAAYQTNHAGGRRAYERFWASIERVSATKVSGDAPNRAQATLTYYYKDARVVRERTAYRLVNEGGVLKISSSTVLSSSSQ